MTAWLVAPQTRRTYLHLVAGLAQFYQPGPEHLNLGDIRQYQVYLANECRYSAELVNQFLSAVKFLYGTTLEAPFDTLHHSQPAANLGLHTRHYILGLNRTRPF